MADTFAGTVQQLDCIDDIPARLMLAHLVYFCGVNLDLVKKLADEYSHANQQTLQIIQEFTDNSTL